MKKVTKLQANNWNGKIFTSASHLNDLFRSGVINREETVLRSGLHWTCYSYTFITHDGIVLAKVEKYSDHGFCSQAYGVEIPVSSLRSKKEAISYDVWENDRKLFRKYPVLASLAVKERGTGALM